MMKKSLILIFALLIVGVSSGQPFISNGIGTTNPDPSAVLHLESANQGFLMPRLTTAARLGIVSPANGLIVYDTDVKNFFFYDGLSWQPVVVGQGVMDTSAFIMDADRDTRVHTESFPGENIIRFYQAGVEYFRMDSGRLEIVNTGNSVFIGEGAGMNDDLTNNNNVFIGAMAGNASWFGHENTAIGTEAMKQSTTANWNVAVGYQAMANNISGYGNIAIGYQSIHQNNNGYANTAAGYQAMYANVTGYRNAAYGYGALHENFTGYHNTAIGYYALYNNASAYRNTAIGYQSMYSNTNGIGNMAGGYQSMYFNTAGEYNTALGYEAMYYAGTGHRNIAIGMRALYRNNSRSHLIAIGDSALYNNGSGVINAWDATGNTAIGSKAMFSNRRGAYNTAVGYKALYANTIGNNNIAVGYNALLNNTNGNDNQAFGYSALSANTTGSANAAFGFNALQGNTTGSYRTAVGAYANSTGMNYDNNAGFGYQADPTASNRIHIGNTSVNWIGGQVGWSTFSDARVKSDIKEDVEGLDFIMKLRPVTFRYDIQKEQHLMYGRVDSNEWKGKYDIEQIRFSGFIAQEVENAMQQTGYDFSGLQRPVNENTLYSLRYAEFVVPLVKAVQEQQQIIERLTEEIERLKMQSGARD